LPENDVMLNGTTRQEKLFDLEQLLSIDQRLMMMVPTKQPITDLTSKVVVDKHTNQFY